MYTLDQDLARMERDDAEQALALAKEQLAALRPNAPRQQRTWARCRVRAAEHALTEAEQRYNALTE